MVLLNILPICSDEYWKAVFQNGLGCTIGSFLGIFFSYLIYRGSTRQNRKERELLEKSNNTNTRNYFSILVRGMLVTGNQQLINLKKFQDDINANPTAFPLLHYSPMHEFNRVSESQNLDKVLLAFSGNSPSDHQIVNHFSSLVSNADYIGAQFDLLVKQVEKAQAFDHDRKKQIQSLHRELFAMMTDLLSQQTYSYTPAVHQAMEKVRNDFMGKQGSPSDLKFIFDEFIIPLNNAMEALYNAGGREQVVSQLGSTSTEAIRIYEDMQKQVLSIAEDIKEVSVDIKEKGLDKLRENATMLGIVLPE